MPLEQITTEMDVQEPAPKGMVRTEMGRLVKKADQDAWDKGVVESMNKQYFSRGKESVKEKKVAVALKSMGGKFSDIYTGPAETNPGVLKAKADKAKADSNISAYKKKADKIKALALESMKKRK
jgi:hypothetical protein